VFIGDTMDIDVATQGIHLTTSIFAGLLTVAPKYPVKYSAWKVIGIVE
jgi:hypothetical protein